MSDKTYAETRGEAPFDWNKELARLCAGGELTETQFCDLDNRAGFWVTCACGNQCAIIPRRDEGDSGGQGEPLDGILASLGYEFFTYISEGEWDAAKDTLAAIEARSAVLIAEELAKLNGK